MKVERIQLYENRPDVTLTTYILDDSPEMIPGQKRPAVLVCPGGGYIFCSDREAEPVALRFATMGYHAFVLRYSVYNNGAPRDTPLPADLPINPNSLHPGPMRDIGQAFLTIGAQADEWRVDMAKITLCGFSAGSHNAAMYSVNWQEPIIWEHFGAKPEQFRPAAAILAYGIADYHLMVGTLEDPEAQGLLDTVNIAFLGSRTPSPDQLIAVSPTHHVSASTPPMFIWATAADGLVPVAHSTRMANALADAGIPFELHVFEDGQHGLSLADQTTAGSMLELDADAAQWIGLAGNWLRKRFALSLPAQPAWMLME